MTIKTDLGYIDITNEVLAGIAGYAASSVDGGVNIDLHIAVEHGVNIATVCRSIIGEVRYHVERLTGVDVKNVDIYVESIKAD